MNNKIEESHRGASRPERTHHLGHDGKMLSDRERMDLIPAIRVMHPKLIEAWKVIDRFEFAVPSQTEGTCLSILGGSRMGKTDLSHKVRKRILKKVALSYPDGKLRSDRIETRDGDIRPVIWLKMPTTNSKAHLPEALLAALGDPFPSKGTIGAKEYRLRMLMADQKVKYIIFDESNHVVETKTEAFSYHTAEFIKNELLNGSIDRNGDDIDCPLLFCHIMFFGIKAGESLFELNSQMDNRRFSQFNLSEYDISKPNEANEFGTLLNTIDHKLPFPSWSELSDPEVSKRIHVATHGNIGKLMKLISHAGVQAILEGSDRITGAHFSMAFEEAGLGKDDKKRQWPNPWKLKSLTADELVPKEESSVSSRNSRIKGTGPSTAPTYAKK